MRCQPTQRMSHPARWENIAKPGGDRELTQALQLELKRVHCYGGPGRSIPSGRRLRTKSSRASAPAPRGGRGEREPARFIFVCLGSNSTANSASAPSPLFPQ